MSSPVVLAYSGSLEASAAIPWLGETLGAEVVALTLDVGQEGPVEALRARALACGARRAHVVDARDAFARECVVPTMRRAHAAPLSMAALARPLVARLLGEAAAAEGASIAAHASADAGFHDAVTGLLPGIRVVAPAREWTMDAAQLAAFARDRGVPHAPPATGGGHLLVRRVCDPARSLEGEARLEIAFLDDVPVALNGVAMSAAELLESLSLIAGQYGIGWSDGARRDGAWGDGVSAPAAPVLQSAYAALREPAGTVTVRISRAGLVVLASEPLVTVA